MDANEALAAITKLNESALAEQRQLAKGEKGDRGPAGIGIPGKDGRDGKDAPIPKVKIGSVEHGDEAQVKVHEADGFFVFDFVLPRGARGAKGDSIVGPKGESIVGPKGQSIRGPRGETGVTPTIRVGSVVVGDEASVTAVQNEDGSLATFNFTLPRPKDGSVGATGAPGKDGLSEEEIRNIVTATVIEAMRGAGVMNEHARKLIEIRAKLKKKMANATARHIGEIQDLVGEVDRLFDQG